jgi:hypothetical protein
LSGSARSQVIFSVSQLPSFIAGKSLEASAAEAEIVANSPSVIIRCRIPSRVVVFIFGGVEEYEEKIAVSGLGFKFTAR